MINTLRLEGSGRFFSVCFMRVVEYWSAVMAWDGMVLRWDPSLGGIARW